MEKSNIIVINAVSFERVSGKYWAHHSAGRFTLTKAEHDEIKAEIIKSGKLEIVKPYKAITNTAELAAILDTVI